MLGILVMRIRRAYRVVAFETARRQHQHHNNTDCKDKEHDSFHFLFFLVD